MNTGYFYLAIALMLIFIVRDFLKKRYGIDIDKIAVFSSKNKSKINNSMAIKRNTGRKNLVLLDAGDNKATVMATLRQITGLDYNSAKSVVESIPSEFLSNISDKEAQLTKQALEFVGATVEIK